MVAGRFRGRRESLVSYRSHEFRIVQLESVNNDWRKKRRKNGMAIGAMVYRGMYSVSHRTRCALIYRRGSSGVGWRNGTRYRESSRLRYGAVKRTRMESRRDVTKRDTEGKERKVNPAAWMRGFASMGENSNAYGDNGTDTTMMPR